MSYIQHPARTTLAGACKSIESMDPSSDTRANVGKACLNRTMHDRLTGLTSEEMVAPFSTPRPSHSVDSHTDQVRIVVTHADCYGDFGAL